MTDIPETGPIYQIAYVVPDLQAAIPQWVRMSGAGPFFVVPHFEMTEPLLYGAHAPCDMSIALGFSNGLCVELIEQHDDRSSVYRDMIDSGRFGLHHVARLSRDIDRTIAGYEAHGARCAFRAGMLTSSKLAYLDTRSSLNCFLEIVSEDADVVGTLKMLSDAARGWDFTDPVRYLS